MPVILDYNCASIPLKIEFYNYSEAMHSKRTFTEFYGRQRYMSAMTDETRVDKNIRALNITLNNNNDELQTTRNKCITTYPQVTSITIRSKMTATPPENDSRSK